jgi:hypothetical protein
MIFGSFTKLVSKLGGASGGIRTRDPLLTKEEPHRARLPRHFVFTSYENVSYVLSVPKVVG